MRGIETGLQQVDQDVGDDDEQRGQQQHAEQHVVVAAEHRLEGEPAESRPAEHRLHHHGAAEHAADMHAGERRHGQQRVAQDVARADRKPDSPLARAVRTKSCCATSSTAARVRRA